MKPTTVGLAVLVLALVATPVVAHVPSFPGDNTTPEDAVTVPDAAKSWSFYDSLDRGQVAYYRFSLAAGQRLRVGAFTPAASGFTPSVVLLSPSLPQSGQVPPGVTVPAGMGAEVVTGERPATASYEPFAPSANYHTVSIDRAVDTDSTYLLAVYEPANRSGQVGVTVGYREQFSPTEYATVPFDLVQTHRWAGQSPLVVVAPWLATALGGTVLVRARRRDDWGRPVRRYALAAAALLIAGTGVSTLLQMGLALSKTGPTAGALVTAVFVVVPLACGGWTLALALRADLSLTPRTRVGLAVAGIAALLTWAGFVVGPAILLAIAAIPEFSEAGDGFAA